MGCASSTPMIATAGSEMLKTASHVATDAAKSAEDAVQDVTQSIGKSLDTAKDTVGTAVTGIANELGNAFKEKTDMLDGAKNNLMGKLHIDGTAAQELESNVETKIQNATAEVKHVADANVEDDLDGELVEIERSEDDIPTRAPSPITTTAHDADSLKTSTPEPEIEQALANFMKDSPPTPKPNIAELEKLTTEAVNKTTVAITKETEALKETLVHAVESVTGGAGDDNSSKAAPPLPPVDKNSEVENKRPGTTEWEKYADMLSQNRKFNPSDAFRIGGKFKSHTPHAPPLRDSPIVTTAIQQPNNNATVQRLGLHGEPSDSGLSDSSSARSQNGRKRDHQLLPHTLNAKNTKKFQREFASLVACEPSPLRRISSSKSPGLAKKFAYATTPIRSRSRAQSPAKGSTAFASFATRSSTNNSIQLNKTTPNLSRSSTRNSLFGSTKNLHNRGKTSTAIADDFVLGHHGISTTGLPKSPARVMNTSSFLSSPRASPFCVRKQYTDFLDPAHRPAFVTDLSSKTVPKNLLTPSPYKVRERCSVCYNKYVIK